MKNYASTGRKNSIPIPETMTYDGTVTMPSLLQLQYYGRSFYRNAQKEMRLERPESLLDKFLADIQKRAFRMAEMATGNRDDAFDILQEAMGKFSEKYRSRPADEWGAIFHTVLQSRIRDWYRRESVRNRFRVWFGQPADDEQDPLLNMADEKLRSPEQELQSRQSIALLDQAIRKLPLRQQQVVMLRIFEGMDIEQTARVMGCSHGSVKTHYSRAVHRLREQLGEYWP